jgi:hypothetical protein
MSANNASESRARTLDLLDSYFSDEDIQDLCFQMGIDYENLSGDTKRAKATSLIKKCEHEGKIAELLSKCQKKRSHVIWPSPWDIGGTGKPAKPDELFREATRLRLEGDLEKALELFRQVKRIDPDHPRIDITISAVEEELRASYEVREWNLVPRRLFGPSRRQVWLIGGFAIIAGVIVTIALSPSLREFFGFGGTPTAAAEVTPTIRTPTVQISARAIADVATPTNAHTLTPTSTPTPSPTHTPTPTSTSTPTLEPCQVIEDFEGIATDLTWYSPDPDNFDFFLTNEQRRFGSQSYRIDYAKDDTFQLVGAEVPSRLRNFAWAQTLELYVYGQETILFKLEDEFGNQAEVNTKFAPNPAGWSLLSFNYTNVQDKVDLGHIIRVFFFPTPGDAAASGTIYFDSVRLCR